MRRSAGWRVAEEEGVEGRRQVGGASRGGEGGSGACKGRAAVVAAAVAAGVCALYAVVAGFGGGGSATIDYVDKRGRFVRAGPPGDAAAWRAGLHHQRAVLLVCDDDGRVLLERGAGRWDAPSAVLRAGEAYAEAGAALLARVAAEHGVVPAAGAPERLFGAHPLENRAGAPPAGHADHRQMSETWRAFVSGGGGGGGGGVGSEGARWVPPAALSRLLDREAGEFEPWLHDEWSLLPDHGHACARF